MSRGPYIDRRDLFVTVIVRKRVGNRVMNSSDSFANVRNSMHERMKR